MQRYKKFPSTPPLLLKTFQLQTLNFPTTFNFKLSTLNFFFNKAPRILKKIPIFAPEFAVPYDNIQTIDYQQDFIKLLIKTTNNMKRNLSINHFFGLITLLWILLGGGIN